MVQAAPASMVQAAPASARSPVQAAQAAIEKLGQRSRLNALRTADRGFAHSAKLDGDSILAAAPSLSSLGKLAQTAQAPGWQPATTGSAALLGIHVTVRPAAGAVLDVDAEVAQVPVAELPLSQ